MFQININLVSFSVNITGISQVVRKTRNIIELHEGYPSQIFCLCTLFDKRHMNSLAYIVFKFFYYKNCAHCLRSNESRKCKEDQAIKFPIFTGYGRFAQIINITVCISAVEQVTCGEQIIQNVKSEIFIVLMCHHGFSVNTHHTLHAVSHKMRCSIACYSY